MGRDGLPASDDERRLSMDTPHPKTIPPKDGAADPPAGGERLAVLIVPSITFGWAEFQSRLERDGRVGRITVERRAEDAARAAASSHPAAIFVAGDRDDPPALPLVAALHAASSEAGVVVVGGEVSGELALALGRAGARGIVTWREMTPDLPALCFRNAVSGVWFGTRDVVQSVTQAALGEPHAEAASLLTDRDRELLRVLARGVDHRTAADRLGMSAATFGRALGDVKDKLGATNDFTLGMWTAALGVAWLEDAEA